MRPVLMAFATLSLLLGLAACQSLAPAPITPLPGEPPVRLGPAPTAPPAATILTGPTSVPRAGLVVAVNRVPLSLDPGDFADPDGAIVLRQIFDTLTQYREGSAEIEPGLATAWQANSDATEWTFTLRDGVRFHDGTPLTAEAVKFNFDRWLDPASLAGARANGKQFQVWSDVFGGYRGAGSLITEAEVVGPLQVRLRLARPTSYLPAVLALPYFGISSPTAIRAAGMGYGGPQSGAVGTGAYRVAAFTNSEVRLERAADTWGPPAAADSLTFRALGDAEAQLAALADGRADLAPNLPVERDKAASGLGLIAVPRPQLGVTYLALNQRFRPLDDARVREAIALALNPADLAARSARGSSTAADQFVPPGLRGRLTDAAPAPNLEQARALLAEAGFPNGLSEVAGPDGALRPLELWVSNPPQGAAFVPLAENIAAQLAAAGIRVKVRQDEWTSFLAERKQGRFPLLILDYPAPSVRVDAVADPHLFLNALFGPLTVGETGWNQPTVLERLRAAEATADPARREEVYR
ncbi:MAG: hypothetical protein KIS91_09490, partial [Anaerolineae bacterium]|nr:hypothetical protein [Anaerolineae bacterium]